MRRLSQWRVSLPAARSSWPLAPRFYSSNDEAKAPKKTRSAKPRTHEPDIESLFQFKGSWTGVDVKKKTIKTAVGPLPVSPLMDATWVKAKKGNRKKKEPAPFAKQGRFQRLLRKNPYAQMLAEPVRQCHATSTRLPTPFLQPFGLVTHPETDELWWVPAGIEQQPEAATDPLPTEETASSEQELQSHDFQEIEEPAEPTGKFRAPAKALARQDLLQEFNNKKFRYGGGQYRFAVAPGISNKAGRAFWRKDMDQVLRNTMRRSIVDALIFVAQDRVGLVKLDKAEDSQQYQNRVCFLLISGHHIPFDYFEVPDVPGTARPAYHLPELLGPEQLQRLETEAPQFRDGPLWLLKGKANTHITKRLWSLQGFVADYQNLERTK